MIVDTYSNSTDITERALAEQQANAALTPEQLGYMDAADGKPFAPETYYANPRKRLDYAFGFHRRNGSQVAAEYIDAAIEEQIIRADEEDETYAFVHAMGRPGGI